LWQALPTTDKRGPCWQRAVHANACNLLDVHSTWVFLPWHRAFIYFHERTLERLLHNAGDLAPFRLPAWDWENNPAVPLAYESSPTHPESCTHRCHDLSKPVCCHVDQLSHDSLAAWRGADFAGWQNVPPTSSGSAHLKVHTTVSAVMGNFDNSALDPLFYSHHANVDRFFEDWKCLYQPCWKKLISPDNTAWLNHSFVLFDENQQAQSVQIRQLLDTAPLGYDYVLPTGIPKAVNVKALEPSDLTALVPTQNQRILLQIRLTGLRLDPGLYQLKLATRSGPARDVGSFGVSSAHHHQSADINEQFVVSQDLARESLNGKLMISPTNQPDEHFAVKDTNLVKAFQLIRLESVP
jgi:polyphenol oxidase